MDEENHKSSENTGDDSALVGVPADVPPETLTEVRSFLGDQSKVLPEGERLPEVLTEGEEQPEVLTEGEEQSEVLTEGEEQSGILTEGEEQPEVLTEGEEQSEVFNEGEEQSKAPTRAQFPERGGTAEGEREENDVGDLSTKEDNLQKQDGKEKKGKKKEKGGGKKKERKEEGVGVEKAKGKKGKKWEGKGEERGGGEEKGDVETQAEVKGKSGEGKTQHGKGAKSKGKKEIGAVAGKRGEGEIPQEQWENNGVDEGMEVVQKAKKVKARGKKKKEEGDEGKTKVKRKKKKEKTKKKQKGTDDEESEAKEEEQSSMADTGFRRVNIPGGGLVLPGVKRVTISPETQQQLGCVIGVNVTSESPWVFVEKTLIDDSLFLHTESSDFLPIKEEFQEVKLTSLLIGYDALHDEPNQFYICLTEKAQEAILEMLEEMKLEQQRRLENALEKTPREWTSLGSEKDVELFTIKNTRPYMRVLVETRVDKICQPVNFSDRDVEDAKDGYYRFVKRDEPPDQIWCYRLDAGVQVRNPSVDAETQTRPYIPYNSWTQYQYDVDTEAPIEDEGVLQSLAQFLERVEAPVSEILSYNEILDNYRDDYAKLVVDDADTDIPQSNEFTEFISFTDVKHCQGKAVSCVAFHPMWTGIVAIGYVEQGNVDVPKLEKLDEIAQEVYTTNPVLIWSVNDAFKPKLILESPREVYSLAFAPHKEELLVGGLSNGQIVIWDIQEKIERVETEIKLTPAQIRHNLAMMNMMDWMKQTIHVKYLRPVAVSSLQHSHTDVVYQLRFLHPCWTITSAGKFEALKDSNSTLVMSLSLDSTMLVWNLDPETNPSVGIAVRARKRKSAKRPDGLKSEISPYALFHRAISPSLKVDLPLSGDRVGEMFRSMDIYSPTVQYIPNEEEWAKLSSKQKESSVTRFKYLPVLTLPKDDEQVERAMIGTTSGQLLWTEWEESEPRSSTVIQNLNCNIEYSSHIHDGPVLRVIRSPFIDDLYLTIDWGKFALWSTKLKNKPFLWRRPKGGKRYLSGTWSTVCPTAFRLSCSDGSVEVWDLATRSEIHTILQNVSGKALNVFENHPRVLPANLVGIADSAGCFRLFFDPMQYQETSRGNQEKMNTMLEREVTRTTTMKQWVQEWRRRHAEELKEKKAVEEAKKQEEEQKRRKTILHKAEESSVETTEKPGRKKYAKLVDEKNLEMQRQHMMKMMMEKKRIDTEDLERKRAPLVQAQEAMQLKQLKIREVLKHKNTIFRETINVMFPEVSEKPPPKPTDCEVLAAALHEKEDSFVQDYKALEAVTLSKLRKPAVVDNFNWKRVMQNGKERREVLDLELFQQTEWRQRAEERRNERRLHKESELRREDEKRRKKKGSEMAPSSQTVFPSGSATNTFFDDEDELTESRMLLAQSSKMSVKQRQSKMTFDGRPQSSKVSVKQKESRVILPPNESSKVSVKQNES